jgi:GTP-dependent phosphoenolpyruvate carboxykinase
MKVQSLYKSQYKLFNEPIVSVELYPSMQGKLKYSVHWIKNYNLIITDPKQVAWCQDSNKRYNTLRTPIIEIHSMNKTESSALKIAKILESEIVDFFENEKQFHQLFSGQKYFENHLTLPDVPQG